MKEDCNSTVAFSEHQQSKVFLLLVKVYNFLFQFIFVQLKKIYTISKANCKCTHECKVLEQEAAKDVSVNESSSHPPFSCVKLLGGSAFHVDLIRLHIV